MKNQPELLTTREAAERLGLSPRTLERYRVTGEGPRFRKIGRWVRYTPGGPGAVAGRLREQSSTSGDGRAAAVARP